MSQIGSSNNNSSYRTSPNKWTGVGGSTEVFNPKGVEESQGVNRNIGAPSGISTAEQVSGTENSNDIQKKNEKKDAKKVTARPMAEADIVDQLLKLQRPPTPENRQILMAMIQHGIEASEEHFNLISKLKKKSGHAQNNIESAVVTVAKGLGESPKTVDIIAQFLSKNSHFSKQLAQLKQTMASFRASLHVNQSLFETGLLTGLNGILSELDDQLKKLSKKTHDGQVATMIDRKGLSDSFLTLSGFLGGLKETLGKDAKPILRPINQFKADIASFVQTLLLQGVLSKDSQTHSLGMNERFAFWQLPNPMAAGPKNIDVLIRKRPGGRKKNRFDPNKTRMVMKVETESLGELGISIDVLDKKLWYIFESDRFETQQLVKKMERELLERMTAIDYQTAGIKSVKKKVDIKKLLLPVHRLNSLSRIDTEI